MVKNNKNGKIYIVGIGPGSKDYLTKKAISIVEKSDYTVGSTRAIELLFVPIVKVTSEALPVQVAVEPLFVTEPVEELTLPPVLFI